MTPVAELLDAVHAEGVELRRSADGRLQVRDPEHRMPAELRHQLREREAELMAALDPAEAKRRKDHGNYRHHGRPVPWWRNPAR